MTTLPVPAYPRFDPIQQEMLLAHLHVLLEGLSPELIKLARSLFDRLTPLRWPVEWHLPWWLGQGYDLPEQDIRSLVLCNLAGLGYVRLEDTVMDEKVSQADRRRHRQLAGVLQALATQQLKELFADRAEFWQRHDEAMDQWQRALGEGEVAPDRRFDGWTQDDFRLLGWRGAPVKITAVGACFLSGRTDLVPVVLEALDELLIAQVLLDHLDDWQADLEAGRFNAFVAFASDLPQTSATKDSLRRQVLHEFIVGEAGEAYIAVARAHLRAALRHAEAIPCTGLASYLIDFDRDTRLSQAALRSQIRNWLRDAATEIFGPPQPDIRAATIS